MIHESGDFQLEYRHNDDGTLDEVVMVWKNPITGESQCLFHLESMGEEHWYAGVYLPGHGWQVAGRVAGSSQLDVNYRPAATK